ncbi:MAG TPA: hypothetical protein VGQ76_24330 [Thermoanaerobaculia bacterium]|jgi:uncharacterized membrane protein|nr:hypothetical protein [Thermoanaerobaculia bacterium]
MTFDRIRIGTTFFAIALIGLGVEHFVFGDFITGRAPSWPDGVPGKTVFAVLTGMALIATGLSLLIRRGARNNAAIVAAILIASWALLRHIPVLFAVPFLSGAWTGAGKALVFSGGAFAVSGVNPKGSILVGRWSLGLFLLIAGVQHFLFAKFVATLIPRWFPGNSLFWSYFAGVALICGGIGLMIPRTARLAAFWSGIMVFSWFWIVHVPRVNMGMSDQIAVFEALLVSGIAFVLSGDRNIQ